MANLLVIGLVDVTRLALFLDNQNLALVVKFHRLTQGAVEGWGAEGVVWRAGAAQVCMISLSLSEFV